MAELNKDAVTLEELMVSTLATADALAKLLIGTVTEGTSRLSDAVKRPQAALKRAYILDSIVLSGIKFFTTQ